MEQLQAVLEGTYGSHILPFLWMKGEDNATIARELDKIEECGIREVCLESRPHPDFCGPGWWENLDFICEEAKRRGMRLWILDDDKFPTGHANGGFERQPGKRKLYLAERHMDICGPCRGGAVLVENFCGVHGTPLGRDVQIGHFPDEKLLGILAVPKPDGESLAVDGEGILDLTENCENGFVYFDLPEGTYRLFVLFTTRKGGGRDNYMNLIDSASVRVLVDEVYEKHYARYKAYFGNTIAGFFSDEPELGNVNGYPFDNTLGQKDRKLPWSRQLEEELRDAWGGQFLQNLPALWYPSGEKTAYVRSVYMDRMTSLVEKCFSGQLGRWCADHGVEYIGHIIEDDNAHTRMACSIGHYFREMAGQHMAGIDVVHHQIVPGFTEIIHQWIAGDRDGEFFQFGLAKLGSSAAHIQKNKQNRALCEIFGNYGWAEGNSFMKWLTNHMLVRGINQFTPHAFSMRYPDPDCPPHFYAGGNNPGFSCFAQLMHYMNRAAHLLGAGVHLADAAVLYHGESEWCGGACMYYQKPGRKLMEKGLDYDVVPADALGTALPDVWKAACQDNSGQEAVGRTKDETDGRMAVDGQIEVYHPVRTGGGRLWIGQESYVCLILPYARYLEGRVIRFVAEAAARGLKVLVVDALPEGDVYGSPLPEGWRDCVEVVPLEDIAGRVATLAQEAGSRELVVEPMAGEEEKPFPWLRSYLVRQADGVVAMYFNESVSQRFCGRIQVKNPAYKEVSVYDPWQNRAERYALPDQPAKREVPLYLEPGEALFYCFEDGKGNTAEDTVNVMGTGEKPAREIRQFPVVVESIVLDLDWKVYGKPKQQEPERAQEASQESRQQGFSGIRDRRLEEGILLQAGQPLPNLNGPGYWPSFVGIYLYEGSFCHKKEEGKRYFLLFPEASDSICLRINGKDLGFLAGFPARMDITEALADGLNQIRVEVTTTLVWQLKDGASTHLQVPPSGMTQAPVLQVVL